MNKLLELKNISLTYQTKDDEIKAIENLSFSCNEGEFLSIIGPSGCGKTTVLSIIAGLIKPTAGNIQFYEQGKANHREVGYMLQKDYLFPWRNIEKNIYLPLEIKKRKDKDSEKYVNTLLEKYGLIDFKKKYPEIDSLAKYSEKFNLCDVRCLNPVEFYFLGRETVIDII